MKRIKRFVLAFVILAMSGAVFGGLTGCDTSGKTKLYFDGGGGSGNYTTTSSYDTLEELAKEWNANNDRFEIGHQLRFSERQPQRDHQHAYRGDRARYADAGGKRRQ